MYLPSYHSDLGNFELIPYMILMAAGSSMLYMFGATRTMGPHLRCKSKLTLSNEPCWIARKSQKLETRAQKGPGMERRGERVDCTKDQSRRKSMRSATAMRMVACMVSCS